MLLIIGYSTSNNLLYPREVLVSLWSIFSNHEYGYCVRGLILNLFNLFNPTAGGQPQAQVEAVVADDAGYESAEYDATDGFGIRASAEAAGAPKDRIEAPKVSLRSFFPETWLFTLDPVNEDTNLSR